MSAFINKQHILNYNSKVSYTLLSFMYKQMEGDCSLDWVYLRCSQDVIDRLAREERQSLRSPSNYGESGTASNTLLAVSLWMLSTSCLRKRQSRRAITHKRINENRYGVPALCCSLLRRLSGCCPCVVIWDLAASLLHLKQWFPASWSLSVHSGSCGWGMMLRTGMLQQQNMTLQANLLYLEILCVPGRSALEPVSSLCPHTRNEATLT